VDGIEKLYQEYSDKGVEFIQKLREDSWGMREFGIRTIDGPRIIRQDIEKDE